jgi:hypothetical protein
LASTFAREIWQLTIFFGSEGAAGAAGVTAAGPCHLPVVRLVGEVTVHREGQAEDP